MTFEKLASESTGASLQESQLGLDPAELFARDGVLWPVPIVDPSDAGRLRQQLEAAEARLGPLHYVNKIHTVMAGAFELATHPQVLDVVERLIGPDILLYNSTFIIKEPNSDAHVSWHQDLTYWGLADDDAQVSMWLALAPATAESGCMVAIAGSHLDGRIDHVERPSDSNVLLLGQEIADVDASFDVDAGVACELEPGQASFHHGWTVHSSPPNRSDDRRIGLNVQFVAPHNRQAGDATTATLVRGEDRFGFYEDEPRPSLSGEVDGGDGIDELAGIAEADGIERLLAADQKMKDSFRTRQNE